jgi:hypothetical protein
MFDRPEKHRLLTKAALLLALFAPATAAHAALGEKLASVERDRSAFGGTLRSRNAPGHVVHEIETPEGGRAREFVSPSGTVFGVAWEGPRIPNMRQLLGSNFGAYEEAARARHQRRGPMVIEIPGLVFESYGHARAFSGRAYVPALLPAGVSTDAIR